MNVSKVTSYLIGLSSEAATAVLSRVRNNYRFFSNFVFVSRDEDGDDDDLK